MSHKLGIIGLGFMGGYHEINARNIDGLEVRAVYDIKESQRELARSKGLIAYETLEDFIADDEIDLVVIAVPNNFHPEYAIRCMEAGKNVICEKPVAITLEEYEAMVACAERTGKVFTVHQNRRWDKDYRMVNKTVQSGDLGKVYCYESRIHGKNGKFLEWRDVKEAGGGILLDWAPHLVDQILLMQKEKVISVYAQMTSVLSKNVDDYCKILLRFESGCTAMIEVGTLVLCSGPRWVVHGDAGSMQIDSFACDGQIIKDKVRLAEWSSNYVSTEKGPTRTMAPRPKETLEFKELPGVDGETDPLDLYRNVLNVMDGKEELYVTHHDVRRVMQIIEACRESERLGMGIKVNI